MAGEESFDGVQVGGGIWAACHSKATDSTRIISSQ